MADGLDDFCKYPYETLAEGCGDAEDKSILFASLAASLGYHTILIVMENHTMVGVHLNSSPTQTVGWNLNIGDSKHYYFCETTTYGWQIGELPEAYYSEELRPTPVIMS